jgi:Spy/CpxP family protein refolding chaperone
MKTTIKIAMAAALLAGASSLAMAQMSGPTGNPQTNAAASGGSGTHQSGGPKTGTASNTQKVMKNQNGYQGQQ